MLFEFAAAASVCVGAAALRHKLPLPLAHRIFEYSNEDLVVDAHVELIRDDVTAGHGSFTEVMVRERLLREEAGELRAVALTSAALEALEELYNASARVIAWASALGFENRW
eukprot:15141255-Alexandrium_andersonii.AAC.1